METMIPPPPAPQPASWQAPIPAAPPGNGMAVAGLVLGLVGILFGLPMILFPLAGLLGVLGIVFGAIGRKKANAGAAHKSIALWGVITGVGALGLSFVGFGVTVAAVGSVEAKFEEVGNQLESYDQCTDNTPYEDWTSICSPLLDGE